MGERIPSDSVLALGEKLVDELGLDQSVDTLGRWMAHYIAEKIEDTEAATGEARNLQMSDCSDAILKLWAHRRELPDGHRPFEEFEPIFRVLKSLDLEEKRPRYFPHEKWGADENHGNGSTGCWVDFATKIDCAARILIRYCFAMAAKDGIDKSRNLVTLAEAIEEDDSTDFDIQIVSMITDDSDAMNQEEPADSAKVKIEGFLKKLDAFTDLSGRLSSQIREQLDHSKS